MIGRFQIAPTEDIKNNWNFLTMWDEKPTYVKIQTFLDGGLNLTNLMLTKPADVCIYVGTEYLFNMSEINEELLIKNNENLLKYHTKLSSLYPISPNLKYVPTSSYTEHKDNILPAVPLPYTYINPIKKSLYKIVDNCNSPTIVVSGSAIMEMGSMGEWVNYETIKNTCVVYCTKGKMIEFSKFDGAWEVRSKYFKYEPGNGEARFSCKTNGKILNVKVRICRDADKSSNIPDGDKPDIYIIVSSGFGYDVMKESTFGKMLTIVNDRNEIKSIYSASENINKFETISLDQGAVLYYSYVTVNA